MLDDIEKEKLNLVAQLLDVLSAEEAAHYAHLLLTAADRISLLEAQLAEKQKFIEGEMKKSMDELSAFVLAGLNIR